MTTVKNVYDYINSFAPFSTQEKWDNAGALVGGMRQEVKKCVVTLDVTKECVAFAAQHGAQLIVSHHPAIFGGLKSITSGTAVYDAVRNNISVISAHTNFDIARGGMNDVLAGALELEDVIADESGFLRFGKLKEEMSSDKFALFVKEKLGCGFVRFTSSSRPVLRVALCSGAGSDFLEQAKASSDAFVTGDMSYHAFLDMAEDDFCVVSAGHYETEYIGAMALCDKLSALFNDVEFLKFNQQNPVKTV